MHADSTFVGWEVGNSTSVYRATRSPSSLVRCTFQDDDSAPVQHGEHAVVESLGGAPVRIEDCVFSLADGARLHLHTPLHVRCVVACPVLGVVGADLRLLRARQGFPEQQPLASKATGAH